LPVIFIHRGKQNYLKHTIKLAQEFNETVILLGDSTNRNICKKWADISELDSLKFQDFQRLYIHLSSNNYDYELFCFERYFLLEEYMRQNHIEECIMSDSDVCTFINYSLLHFPQYEMAAACMYYRDPSKWMVVPHVTYWRKERLTDFTEYLIRQYRDQRERLTGKHAQLIESKASYGISDMSLLYLWVTECCKNFWNLAIARDGQTFDVFLTSRTNCDGVPFQMVNDIKKIVFQNKLPYFVTEDGNLLRANVLHAQGDSKKYIPMLVRRRYSLIEIRLADFLFWIKKTKERGKRFIARYIGADKNKKQRKTGG